MAKVSYYLQYKDRDHSPILLRYNQGHSRFTYSTGQYSSPKDWNPKTHRPRKTHPTYKSLTNFLEKLSATVIATQQRFRAEGKVVTNADYKRACDIATGKINPSRPNLISFTKELAEDVKADGGEYRVYSRLAYQLENFVNRYRMGREFENVDQYFLESFERYLIKEQASNTYVKDLFKRLRGVMKKARAREYTKNRITDDFRARVKAGKEREKTKVFLTLKEIKQLYEWEFESERLSRARDMLVTACLTGLSYIDWEKLDLADLGNSNVSLEIHPFAFIQIVRNKSEETAWVPILPTTKAILKKYGGKLPKISGDKARKYAREAAREAGISESVKRSHYKGGQREEKVIEKWEAIGTHTGRHSLNTNLALLDCPERLINAVLGWKGKGMSDHYFKAEFAPLAPKIIPYLEKIADELKDSGYLPDTMFFTSDR